MSSQGNPFDSNIHINPNISNDNLVLSLIEKENYEDQAEEHDDCLSYNPIKKENISSHESCESPRFGGK